MVEKTTPEDFFLKRSKLKAHPNNYKSNKNFDQTNIIPPKGGRGNAYRHTKSGFREDLNLNLRSNWEANTARIMNLYKIKFEFEPKVFNFPIKRGTKSYTPDFFLSESEEWMEIKGYLDDKSKLKIKRFKKYYPEEFKKMIFVISKYSAEARAFAEEMEISNVLFYEDMKKFFVDKIKIWEGK
jgi:hypothetical protein